MLRLQVPLPDDYTLATDDELRLVDGAQYLDGGPCEDRFTGR